MAAVQCKVDIPKVSGLEDSQLTVGREFYLNCTGDWPKTLKPEAAHFELADGAKYQLKLLNFEFRNPTEADLKVTSYVAGAQKFPNLVVTDGVLKIEMGEVGFEVQSVLPKDEKVEPYGPIGPATISIPLLYWLILFGTLGLVFGYLGLRFWRYQQRKEMLESLKQHDSALTPLQEFHQSMRKLQRENSAFYGKEPPLEELRAGTSELDRMFKIYLSRRLHVPAFEWNERLVLKDIRKYHRALYDESSRKIKDLYIEFKKAQAAATQGDAVKSLKANDVSQLADTLRKTLEKIEKFLEEDTQKTRGGRR